jgi:hypothetical protein
VDKVFETRHKSKLFVNFYYPDQYEKQHGDPFKRFGFDWPQRDDLIDLCMKHNCEPKDLVLDRLHWIREGCGYGMLQLGFKGGIVSP